VVLGDHVDDVAHDAADLEVLARVDARYAGLAQGGLVGRRDDAADTTGTAAAACSSSRSTAGIGVRPGQNPQ
jgi:hypothetical protein